MKENPLDIMNADVMIISNFKFLQFDPSFAPFMGVAIVAEKILHIDPVACSLNCCSVNMRERKI